VAIQTRTATWFVYILECRGGSLYTGVTTDLDRRLEEHSGGRGAKYTAARLPVRLAYQERHRDRSSAQTREATIKRMTREKKLALIGPRLLGRE
jgi:putative endonuclease